MALVGPTTTNIYDKRFTLADQRHRPEGAAVRRLPLGGGAGLVRRRRLSWSGATSRTTACCAGCRTAAVRQRLPRRFELLQRQHPRPRGPARHLRARRRGASRRTEYDGSITVIADSYKGKRLNSPNDVVVKSDGTIWFTDPSYGIMSDYEGHKARAGAGRLLRLPHRSEERQARGRRRRFRQAERPRLLARRIDALRRRFRLRARAGRAAPHPRLQGRRKRHSRRRQAALRPEAGFPDGFRVDTDGNVWTSAGAGVDCFAPEGDLLGRINFPQIVSNLVFGGPKRNRLFVTCTHELYSVYVTATGAQRP